MKVFFLAATITGFALLAAPQATKEIKKIPVSPTKADSGMQMYKTYCASCHGVDGKGHGPAAEALKVAPADLTTLKRSNDGKFPSAKLSHILERGDVTAHGSSEMPVWGPIFRSLDRSNAALSKLRIVNVIKYIESMQE
jgi:mono/diheme cytochrome c family protein